MDDENSINGENNVDITPPTEKQYLIEFIKTWNLLTTCDKVRKNNALKKLLNIY